MSLSSRLVSETANRGCRLNGATRWLPSDERFDLFGALFGLALANHVLASISEKVPSGSLDSYIERWTAVKATVGWPSWSVQGLDLVLLLGALALMLLPWKRALLALLALPFALSLVATVERYSSHAVLIAFALVLVLLTTAGALVSRRLARRGTTDWLGWTRLGLAGLLVLSYQFSAFYKLNPGWFAPRGDGAVFLAGLAAQVGLPALAGQTLASSPSLAGVIAIEAALPFLLLWPRSRPLGLLLGILFHLLIMLRALADFSALVLAFYPLFLSRREASELLARARSRPPLLVLALLFAATVVGFGWYRRGELVARSGVQLFTPPFAALDAISALATLVLFLYALAVVVGWARARPVRSPESETFHPRPGGRGTATLVVVIWLLFVGNNLAPFFDLPHAGPMWMYSGIDPRGAGHSLLPRLPLTGLYAYVHDVNVGPARPGTGAVANLQAFVAQLQPAQEVSQALLRYQVAVACSSAPGLQLGLRFVNESGQFFNVDDACLDPSAPTSLEVLLKPNDCIPSCREVLTRWARDGFPRR
jgi:vitamin K-dependent gamma-carboxylase-like protein